MRGAPKVPYLLYADLILAEKITLFSSNLDGVCKAGDSVLALCKGPEVPY